MAEDVAQEHQGLVSAAAVTFVQPYPAAECLAEGVRGEDLRRGNVVPGLDLLEDQVHGLAGDGLVLSCRDEDEGVLRGMP